jgi:hypothetical protein
VFTNRVNGAGKTKLSTDTDVIKYIDTVSSGMNVTKYGLLFEYAPGNYCLSAAESLDDATDIDAWYDIMGLDKFIKTECYSDMNFERHSGTTFIANVSEDSSEVPLFYYPCYEIVDDNGIEHSYHESDKGLVEVDNPAIGNHTITLVWTDFQKASLFITLLSVSAFIILRKKSI